jgi:hypothetical protein
MTRTRASLVAQVLVAGVLACQSVPKNQAPVATDLFDTWLLVSWKVTDARGQTAYPFGRHPVGQIIYTDAGHMSAQLTNPDLRVEDVSGMDEEDIVGRVSRTFFAYHGTYSVDLAAGTVTHHVQGSIRPSWIGTNQKRGFAMIDADHMKLFAITGDTASGETNFPGSNVLLWERAP